MPRKKSEFRPGKHPNSLKALRTNLQGSSWNAEKIERWKGYIRDDLPGKHIANKEGLSPGSVRVFLTKHKVKLGLEPGKRRPLNTKRDAEVEAARKNYKKGGEDEISMYKAMQTRSRSLYPKMSADLKLTVSQIKYALRKRKKLRDITETLEDKKRVMTWNRLTSGCWHGYLTGHGLAATIVAQTDSKGKRHYRYNISHLQKSGHVRSIPMARRIIEKLCINRDIVESIGDVHREIGRDLKRLNVNPESHFHKLGHAFMYQDYDEAAKHYRNMNTSDKQTADSLISNRSHYHGIGGLFHNHMAAMDAKAKKANNPELSDAPKKGRLGFLHHAKGMYTHFRLSNKHFDLNDKNLAGHHSTVYHQHREDIEKHFSNIEKASQQDIWRAGDDWFKRKGYDVKNPHSIPDQPYADEPFYDDLREIYHRHYKA